MLRERASRDWIAFAPRETRAWVWFPDLIIERKEQSELISDYGDHAAKSVMWELLCRTVSAEERARRASPSVTTQAEFERVMGWTWNAGLLRLTNPQVSWATIEMTGGYVGHDDALRLRNLQWHGTRGLWDGLRDFFSAEGWQWEASNWGSKRRRKLRNRCPYLRAFIELGRVRWQIALTGRGETSFHQQLEARLQLRDWLHEKVPGANSNDWLQILN